MGEEKHGMELNAPLVVLDGEWTNSKPRTARLVSLCLIRLTPDGKRQERSWMFNPGEPIEPAAEAVHGISNADVTDKARFSAHAEEILEMLGGADIGGYCVLSDLLILAGECERAGHEFDMMGRRIIDGLRVWQAREPRKLANAYERFVGTLPEDTKLHDATEDARLIEAVIKQQLVDSSVDEADEQSVGDLVDLQRRFRRDEDGVVVFNFGKHMGSPANLQREYVEWMLKQDFAADTKQACQQILREAREDARR